MLTQLFTDKVENINQENQIADYKKEEIEIMDNILAIKWNVSIIYMYNRLEYTFKSYGVEVVDYDLILNYAKLHSRFYELIHDN